MYIGNIDNSNVYINNHYSSKPSVEGIGYKKTEHVKKKRAEALKPKFVHDKRKAYSNGTDIAEISYGAKKDSVFTCAAQYVIDGISDMISLMRNNNEDVVETGVSVDNIDEIIDKAVKDIEEREEKKNVRNHEKVLGILESYFSQLYFKNEDLPDARYTPALAEDANIALDLLRSSRIISSIRDARRLLRDRVYKRESADKNSGVELYRLSEDHIKESVAQKLKEAEAYKDFFDKVLDREVAGKALSEVYDEHDLSDKSKEMMYEVCRKTRDIQDIVLKLSYKFGANIRGDIDDAKGLFRFMTGKVVGKDEEIFAKDMGIGFGFSLPNKYFKHGYLGSVDASQSIESRLDIDVEEFDEFLEIPQLKGFILKVNSSRLGNRNINLAKNHEKRLDEKVDRRAWLRDGEDVIDTLVKGINDDLKLKTNEMHEMYHIITGIMRYSERLVSTEDPEGYTGSIEHVRNELAAELYSKGLRNVSMGHGFVERKDKLEHKLKVRYDQLKGFKDKKVSEDLIKRLGFDMVKISMIEDEILELDDLESNLKSLIKKGVDHRTLAYMVALSDGDEIYSNIRDLHNIF